MRSGNGRRTFLQRMIFCRGNELLARHLILSESELLVPGVICPGSLSPRELLRIYPVLIFMIS
jgi:hypothetical protein